jgi:hypothetical protein
MFCNPSSIYRKLIKDEALQKPIHLYCQSSIADLLHQSVMNADGEITSYADFVEKLGR